VSTIRDLWPEDIRSEEVLMPEEILQFQAESLGQRTGGLLSGHVTRLVAEDRIILGFEIEALTIPTRVGLFEVLHRIEFGYPATIILPDEELPDYLASRSDWPIRGSVQRSEDVHERLSWVATSHVEFTAKIEKVLSLPVVKGIVISLISRANKRRAEDASVGDGSRGDS
jgi:hypothetical protein